MRPYQFYIAALLWLFSLPACNNAGQTSTTKTTSTTDKMADKFDWNPGASGPGFYPMEYSNIQFIEADGSAVAMPITTVGNPDNYWGDDQAGVAIGPELKAVPVKLNITWLSYAEDQFYTGTFDLPHEKMLQLFKAGWPDYDHMEHKLITATYDKIIAGMAPGGLVSVWLGGAGHRVEVASFKAGKTTVDMKEFAPSSYTHNQTEYVNDVMKLPAEVEYIKEHGVPTTLWDKYRQRFAMRPVVMYESGPNTETQKFIINYYNGEIETIEKADYQKNEYKPRARVKTIYFYWQIPHESKPERYELEIKLDEAEVMSAYEEIYGANAQGQGELYIQIDKTNDNYLVVLQNENKKVQLHKLQGNIYVLRN